MGETIVACPLAITPLHVSTFFQVFKIFTFRTQILHDMSLIQNVLLKLHHTAWRADEETAPPKRRFERGTIKNMEEECSTTPKEEGKQGCRLPFLGCCCFPPSSFPVVLPFLSSLGKVLPFLPPVGWCWRFSFSPGWCCCLRLLLWGGAAHTHKFYFVSFINNVSFQTPEFKRFLEKNRTFKMQKAKFKFEWQPSTVAGVVPLPRSHTFWICSCVHFWGIFNLPKKKKNSPSIFGSNLITQTSMFNWREIGFDASPRGAMDAKVVCEYVENPRRKMATPIEKTVWCCVRHCFSQSKKQVGRWPDWDRWLGECHWEKVFPGQRRANASLWQEVGVARRPLVDLEGWHGPGLANVRGQTRWGWRVRCLSGLITYGRVATFRVDGRK